MTVRGLVCAGGTATRLGELTRVTNKHLLPVGEWPMILHPLRLLQDAGIKEVLVVAGPEHVGDFVELLGDGLVPPRGRSLEECVDGLIPPEELLLDLDLTYRVQARPHGIADAVGMAESFAGGGGLVVALGDNVYERPPLEAVREWRRYHLPQGEAQIFTAEVSDPERFGVPVRDERERVVDVVEKPPRASFREAVTGLYCYPPSVFNIVRDLRPSARGEFEISEVNATYARWLTLHAYRVEGWWRDVGTPEALLEVGALLGRKGT